jgi:hypothetical protein
MYLYRFFPAGLNMGCGVEDGYFVLQVRLLSSRKIGSSTVSKRPERDTFFVISQPFD